MAKKKTESKKPKQLTQSTTSSLDLVDAAKRAIDRVSSDLRVTNVVTLERLEELRDHLEPMIDAVKEEMNRLGD